MPLTQLSIEVPDLGDNNKSLEVEGAIAVGEKVAVSVSGLPADVSTSEKELRFRVLGPMGEDVATHGGWNYDGTKKTYTTTLDLASVQAFRLFFPPPPPPHPRVVTPIVPMRPPVPLPGYDPVATAAAMQPPNAVNVRLVLELRDKAGSDSDSDGELVDASLIGTSSIRLNYWPTDWQTATLVDLANGKVYSKAEVDELIEAAVARATKVSSVNGKVGDVVLDSGDIASGLATAYGGTTVEDALYGIEAAKPNKGDVYKKSETYGKSHIDTTVSNINGSLLSHGQRITANENALLSKADLVGGKVPSSQLPSYVDDVLEYDSLSVFPPEGESGKIYVALDTNKTYRWTGTQYVEVGGGTAPVLSVNDKTGAVVLDADDVGAAHATHAHSSVTDGDTTLSVVNGGVAKITKQGLGNASVFFAEGYSCSKGNFSYAAPSGGETIEFFGPITSTLDSDHTFWVPAEYKDSTNFDPTTNVWYLVGDVSAPSSHGQTPNYFSLGDEGPYYFVDWEYGGSSPGLTWGNYGTASGTPPVMTRSTVAQVKTVATTDQIPSHVQADWDESDSDDPSFIQNKPTIPQPTPNVQADWDESDSDDDAFIKNKPTIPDVSGKADAASIAPAFSTSSTYAVGDYVTHEGLLYKCTTAVTTAGAWDAANWTAVAVTEEMGADTPLPFDAECEYVTVPAGAYIDPDVLAYDASLGVDITFRIASGATLGEGAFRCGFYTGSNDNSFQLYINNQNDLKLLRFHSTFFSVSNNPFVGSFATASIRGNVFSNGTNKTSISQSSAAQKDPLTFWLCAVGSASNVPSPCNNPVDVAAVKFSFSGISLRNLAPVRIGAVGYLYDKVTGRLFGSAVGSIPLVPGPDKAQPTITTPGRIVELTPAIRYAFASPTPTVSGTAATVACEDRAINDFTVATGITSLTITPPAAVTGRARDFLCRVTLTDSSLPTVTLSGGTIDIGATEVAGMTQGVNLLMFTEIASGHWLASRRSAS